MRLAIIHPFLHRYARGIERFTFNLANALVRNDVETHLLTWKWPRSIQINALDAQVRVHTFPTSRYYAARFIVPFYTWHLLRQAYDFVWVYFAGYGEAETLNFVRRQRFGIVFHYPFGQVPHRYREFQRSGLARRANKIVSVSRFVAEGVQQALGCDSVVIHHGVDTRRFKPDMEARARLRADQNLPADVPLLVTAAALEERKGVQWVLRALPLILRQFPNTVYLVLGDGPYRDALERLAREAGVEKNVRFLGSQADIAPYYQAADISVILARGEASSLTALESMACGLPVVVAQQPPFDELIEPTYGTVVDESDVQAVYAAVTDLLHNSVRRRVMGEAGRARVLADFTWEQVAEQYMQLINSVVYR